MNSPWLLQITITVIANRLLVNNPTGSFIDHENMDIDMYFITITLTVVLKTVFTVFKIMASTLSRVAFLLLYIISMFYIVAILSLVLVRETKRWTPMLSWQCHLI